MGSLGYDSRSMVSILIVNWNTREMLRGCLRSLADNPGQHPTEVIVVDNASTDQSGALVESEFPDFRLLQAPTNLGYAAGNNLAASVATGEFLLTLNPDTEVFSDTIDRAVSALLVHPEIGVVAGKLIGSDGNIQRSVRGFPTFLGIFGQLTGLDRWIPRLASYRLPSFDYGKEQVCDQPMGTFLMFRREALDSVGSARSPFDESFPIFFNEVDLLFRLKDNGWPCLYVPSVRLKHYGGESTKQVRKAMIWESHRSLVRYFKKHRPGLGTSLIAVAAWIGAFVRARGYDAGFRP